MTSTWQPALLEDHAYLREFDAWLAHIEPVLVQHRVPRQLYDSAATWYYFNAYGYLDEGLWDGLPGHAKTLSWFDLDETQREGVKVAAKSWFEWRGTKKIGGMILPRELEHEDAPHATAPVEQWDRYYGDNARSFYEAQVHTTALATKIRWLLPEALDTQHASVWFPGCGLDVAPRLFAAAGCSVWGSDRSRAAIELQRHFARTPLRAYCDMARVTTEYGMEVLDEEARAEYVVHDFTEHTERIPRADMIIDSLTLPELLPRDMAEAAEVFHDRLNQDGKVWCYSKKLTSTQRDALHVSMQSAGFVFEPWWDEPRDRASKSYSFYER